MHTKQKRDRTGELISVPLDETGKLANRIIDIRHQINVLQTEEETVSGKLIDALKEQGRFKISARGFNLRVQETTAVSRILVKREKA